MTQKQRSDQPTYLRFDEATGFADMVRADWKTDLNKINDSLTSKFEFPDKQKHFEFLCNAAEVIQGFSRIEVRGDIVVVPSDLTEFKRTKSQFLRVCEKIDELSELVFALRADATSDMLLQYFDNDKALKKLAPSLAGAMRVFRKIDDYSGAVGNRRTGEWAEDFCVVCQKFWHDQIGGGTRLIFDGERRTRISYWMEDVYRALAECLGLRTPFSKVKTVARSVAAYRPSQ